MHKTLYFKHNLTVVYSAENKQILKVSVTIKKHHAHTVPITGINKMFSTKKLIKEKCTTI